MEKDLDKEDLKREINEAHRTKRITVRFNEAELIEFNNRVPVGCPSASWLRSLALGQPIKYTRKKPPEVDPELLRNLAGIRGSLNQIAKKINSTGLVSATKLITELCAIQRDIESLKEFHTHKDGTP